MVVFVVLDGRAGDKYHQNSNRLGCGVGEGVLTRCRLTNPQSICVSRPIYNVLSSVVSDEKQDSTFVVFPPQIISSLTSPHQKKTQTQAFK